MLYNWKQNKTVYFVRFLSSVISQNNVSNNANAPATKAVWNSTQDSRQILTYRSGCILSDLVRLRALSTGLRRVVRAYTRLYLFICLRRLC